MVKLFSSKYLILSCRVQNNCICHLNNFTAVFTSRAAKALPRWSESGIMLLHTCYNVNQGSVQVFIKNEPTAKVRKVYKDRKWSFCRSVCNGPKRRRLENIFQVYPKYMQLFLQNNCINCIVKHILILINQNAVCFLFPLVGWFKIWDFGHILKINWK